MPSLGFLKKKKTKDDLSSPVSSPTKATFASPTSPTKLSHTTSKEQTPAVSRATTAASAAASQAPAQSQSQSTSTSTSQPQSSAQSSLPEILVEQPKSAEPMQHQQSYPIQQSQPQQSYQQQAQSFQHPKHHQPTNRTAHKRPRLCIHGQWCHGQAQASLQPRA